MTAPTSSPDESRTASRSLPLLGMVAYGELAAFTRLAADSTLAPTLGGRLALARLSGHALGNVATLTGRIRELGADPESTMRPFAGVLVEFDGRTQPSTWWERLLKGFVGYSVSDDFARLLAAGADQPCRELVESAMSDTGHAELVVTALADAGRQDPTLAPRLALWGRRLVGESLNVVQHVLADHQEITDLLARALPGDEPQQRLFARLTAEHTRRMDRLGLAA